jgi:hypothetical protein
MMLCFLRADEKTQAGQNSITSRFSLRVIHQFLRVKTLKFTNDKEDRRFDYQFLPVGEFCQELGLLRRCPEFRDRVAVNSIQDKR